MKLYLQTVNSFTNGQEQNITQISMKYQSTQNVTFLYENTFRILLEQNETISSRLEFCELFSSQFQLKAVQMVNLSSICKGNCLMEFVYPNGFILNEHSEFVVFEMNLNHAIDTNLRYDPYQLKILSQFTIPVNLTGESLKTFSFALSKQKNTTQQSVNILYNSGVIMQNDQYSTLRNCSFTDFNSLEASTSESIIFEDFIIVPNDSTGIHIYQCVNNFTQGEVPPNNIVHQNLKEILKISIEEFFSPSEWKIIEEQYKQDGIPFDFAIQAMAIQPESSILFIAENMSKSIRIFNLTINQSAPSAILISSFSQDSKISSIIIQDSSLYFNQVISKGIREVNSIIEFQSKQMTQSLNYSLLQSYPVSSSIFKVIPSNSLIYSLQENIVTIIRRGVPFKLENDSQRKSMMSIQYSEGAENIWAVPVERLSNHLVEINKLSRTSQFKFRRSNEEVPNGKSENQNQINYISNNITLKESTSSDHFQDVVLVKNRDLVYVKAVKENLPYLQCTPVSENDLSQSHRLNIMIQVFDKKDEFGNIQLLKFVEKLNISVYKDIFENSTVALVVGLSVGLTITVIVIIIVCVYFYRIKNHYQSLLQDSQASNLSKQQAQQQIITEPNKQLASHSDSSQSNVSSLNKEVVSKQGNQNTMSLFVNKDVSKTNNGRQMKITQIHPIQILNISD